MNFRERESIISHIMTNESWTPVGNVVDMVSLLAIKDLPVLASKDAEQEKPKQEKKKPIVAKKKK